MTDKIFNDLIFEMRDLIDEADILIKKTKHLMYDCENFLYDARRMLYDGRGDLPIEGDLLSVDNVKKILNRIKNDG
jgi:hypothetical protein